MAFNKIIFSKIPRLLIVCLNLTTGNFKSIYFSLERAKLLSSCKHKIDNEKNTTLHFKKAIQSSLNIAKVQWLEL